MHGLMGDPHLCREIDDAPNTKKASTIIFSIDCEYGTGTIPYHTDSESITTDKTKAMKFSSPCTVAALVGVWASMADETTAFVGPQTTTNRPSTLTPNSALFMAESSTATKEKTMGAKTAGLLVNYQSVVQELAKVDEELTEIERLRFALQFDSLDKATEAVKERQAWRQGPGADICAAAAAAVKAATMDGGWNNAPVYESAPYAAVINQYITPKSVMTLSTPAGDLIYVIRASAINDKELMDKVTVEQLGEYFLYAKEIHALTANQRSAESGRLCNVIFANDISGVRKAPDKRFSQALTSSSDAYEVLYPSLAGPTMILNLPFILQAFVGLLKPLFPKSVQERLVFTKAPVLANLKELSPLATNASTRDEFVAEVKGLLP